MPQFGRRPGHPTSGSFVRGSAETLIENDQPFPLSEAGGPLGRPTCGPWAPGWLGRIGQESGRGRWGMPPSVKRGDK
jgi:hypothetical protein